jgi:hypothetical protein
MEMHAMKWLRRTQVFYQDGKFRCRVNRDEVDELLAQMPGHPPQADAECWKCHEKTEDAFCVGEEGHEWILVLRPSTFYRDGGGLVTENEVVANAGGYGVVPRTSVKRKLEHMFGS